MIPPTASRATGAPEGSALEVLRCFLTLGVSSFGGPIAHLGYFRSELVQRRGWLTDAAYADLVSLCQFLPGPASSQVGFAIGMRRAGWRGGLAAWLGFTMPSALFLLLFASFVQRLQSPAGRGLLHGLELVAVPVIAQAVIGMARSSCPDLPRALIALAAVLVLLAHQTAAFQLSVIVLGGMLGTYLLRRVSGRNAPAGSLASAGLSRRAAMLCLCACVGLLGGLAAARLLAGSPWIALAEAFYRSGALVFGGGHVVLPLLRSEFVTGGWLSDAAFLSGYGAAQAVPGPLFTFAAYLGAVAAPGGHHLMGAAVGLVAIFLPGLLILTGALPFWDRLRQRPLARAGVAGVNAAVVGVLGAALYDPVWTSSVRSPADLLIAGAGFVLLAARVAPPWLLVVSMAATCAALGAAGVAQ